MLMELIKHVQQTASRFATVDDASLQSKLIIKRPDGQVELLDNPETRRRTEVNSLDSFIDAVNYWHTRPFGDDENWRPVVYVGRDRLICVLDDAGLERYTINFELMVNPWFECAMEKKFEWMNQQQFVRLLRTVLADAVEPNILPLVRSVEFKVRGENRGTVEHGRESLGRSVERAVASVEQIPERVIVHLKPFDNLNFSVGVPMIVDVDLASERFQLFPVGNAIEFGLQEVLENIRDTVSGQVPEGTPVFMG